MRKHWQDSPQPQAGLWSPLVAIIVVQLTTNFGELRIVWLDLVRKVTFLSLALMLRRRARARVRRGAWSRVHGSETKNLESLHVGKLHFRRVISSRACVIPFPWRIVYQYGPLLRGAPAILYEGYLHRLLSPIVALLLFE